MASASPNSSVLGMVLPEPSPTVTALQRNRMLVLALLLLAVVGGMEWREELELSLGLFYGFPIVVAATVLNRWQILIAALICALVRGHFTTGIPSTEFWLQFEMSMLAYGGIGLLVVEMNSNRRNLLAAYARLKLEKEMRHRAQDQLRTLADSSPAAIVTLNDRAEVLAANRAAHELLGFSEPDALLGKTIADYVPLFAGALRATPGGRPMRTHASSWAKRSDGVLFPVATWFSTYEEGGRCYLAGILVDTSEEVRDRERENFRHFLGYNRLVAGAVCHEVRNMCAAIRVVTADLSKRQDFVKDPDFTSLTTLVDSLASIASFELRSNKDRTSAFVNLNTVLEQLRVVIEPDWDDVEGQVRWKLEQPPPFVSADSYALLQVFLNLSQNSLRAVQGCPHPELNIQVRTTRDMAVVSLTDSGPGIRDASRLFQAFPSDGDGSGLGLYISRTLVRSFGGELTFVPTDSGCRFDVALPSAEPLN